MAYITFNTRQGMMQLDLDADDPREFEWVKNNAIGNIHVRMADGSAYKIDMAKWSPRLKDFVRTGMDRSITHEHPFDIEAPLGKPGSLKERFQEIKTPEGLPFVKGAPRAVARMGAGAVKGTFDLGLGIGKLVSNILLPAGLERKVQDAIDLKLRQSDEYRRIVAPKIGKPDFWDALGEFIPDIVALVASGGTAEVGIAGAKTVAKRLTAEELERGILNAVEKRFKQELKTVTHKGISREVEEKLAKRTLEGTATKWTPTAIQATTRIPETAAREAATGYLYHSVTGPEATLEERLKTAGAWALFGTILPIMGAKFWRSPLNERRLSPVYNMWADTLKDGAAKKSLMALRRVAPEEAISDGMIANMYHTSKALSREAGLPEGELFRRMFFLNEEQYLNIAKAEPRLNKAIEDLQATVQNTLNVYNEMQATARTEGLYADEAQRELAAWAKRWEQYRAGKGPFKPVPETEKSLGQIEKVLSELEKAPKDYKSWKEFHEYHIKPMVDLNVTRGALKRTEAEEILTEAFSRGLYRNEIKKAYLAKEITAKEANKRIKGLVGKDGAVAPLEAQTRMLYQLAGRGLGEEGAAGVTFAGRELPGLGFAGAKAWKEISDRIYVGFSNAANPTTLFHELFHAYEILLSQARPEMRKALLEAGTQYARGVGMESPREALAYGFEKYLATGRAPSKEMQRVFEDFKSWADQNWQAVKGTPLAQDMPDYIKKAYDTLFTRQAGTPQAAQAVKAVAGETGGDLDILGTGKGLGPEDIAAAQRDIAAKPPETTILFQKPITDQPYAPEASVLETGKAALAERIQAAKGGASRENMREGYRKFREATMSNIEGLKRVPKYGDQLYTLAKGLLGSSGNAEHMMVSALDYIMEPIRSFGRTKIPFMGEETFAVNIASRVATARRVAYEVEVKKTPLDSALISAYKPTLEAFQALERANPQAYAAVKDTVQRLDGANLAVLKYVRDSGQITDEIFNTIRAANPYYVPLKKQEVEQIMAGTYQIDPGLGEIIATGLKRIKGGEGDVKDAIEATLENYMMMIPLADRHAATAKVVRAIQETMPEAIIQSKTMKVPMSRLEGKIETEEGLKDISRIIVPPTRTLKDSITYQENGEWKEVIFSPEIFRALKNSYTVFNNGLTESAMRIGSYAKTLKRKGVTLYPTFWVRNMVRDHYTRMFNDTMTYKNFGDLPKFYVDLLAKKPLWDYPATFLKILRTENKGLDQFFNRLGYSNAEFEAIWNELRAKGAMGAEMTGGRNIPAGLIKKAAGIETPWDLAMRKGNIFSRLDTISRIIEQVPRFDAAMDILRMDKSSAAYHEAMKRFRSITADFAEQGYWTKDVGRVTPFFTAGWAGLKASVDAYSQNPVMYLAKIASVMTPISIYLWARNHEQDWYKALSTSDKNRYWYIAPDLRIPKGYGPIETLASSGFERFLDKAADKDPEKARTLAWELVNQFGPDVFPMPTVISAAWGYGTGKDPFFGSRIEPYMSEQLSPVYRKKPSTTAVASALANMLDRSWSMFHGGEPGHGPVSPAQIDYFLKEFGGNMAGKGARFIDGAATEARRRGGAEVVRPERRKSGLPITEAFATEPSTQTQYSRYISRAYELKSDYQRMVANINKAEANGDAALKARLEAQYRPKMLAYSGSLKGAVERLSEMNKMYNKISKPETVRLPGWDVSTPAKKRAALVQLAENMNRLAGPALRAYDEFINQYGEQP